MSTLKRLRYTKRHSAMPVALKATEVLYDKMHTYDKQAREILKVLIDAVKEKNINSPALKALYQMMQRADDIVIDCAHKLAPYQTPKLESIEVRNKIEHKFVLRAPQQIKSVEEWLAKTGATVLEKTIADKKQLTPIEPSIHDFDEEEDQIKTNQLLN